MDNKLYCKKCGAEIMLTGMDINFKKGVITFRFKKGAMG